MPPSPIRSSPASTLAPPVRLPVTVTKPPEIVARPLATPLATSNTAPEATDTGPAKLPEASASPTRSMPAEIVVASVPVLATVSVTRPVPVFVIPPEAIAPLPETMNSSAELPKAISAGVTISATVTAVPVAVSSNRIRSPTTKLVACDVEVSSQLNAPPTSTAEPVSQTVEASPRHVSRPVPSTSRSSRVFAVSCTSVASTRGGSVPSVNDDGTAAPSYSRSVNRPMPSDCDDASDTATEPESVRPSGVVTLISGTVGMPVSASMKPSFEPAPSDNVGSERTVVAPWLTTAKAAPAATVPPEAPTKGVEPSVPDITVNGPCIALAPVKTTVPGPVLASTPLPATAPESESTAAGSVTSIEPPPAASVIEPERTAVAPS